MPVWDRLDLTGESGPLGNTFLRQDGSGLAVVLPGRLGGWMTAAVYYPVLAMLDRGFDALCLDSYQEVPDPSTLRDDAAAAVAAGMAAGRYQQVMLAGKSLGTLAMAELILDRPDFAGASTIWLTPLLKVDRVAAALERLRTPGLVVIGSEDSHHDTGVLAELEACSHRVLVVAGAHHGLAIDGNAAASADIPRQLVDAVLGYTGNHRSPSSQD
jgi:pimeloyl-ACP methyl ester carboxylesterase